jgi:hypothetical protein
MQYVVTKQIAIEADSPEEAAYKSKTEGQVMGLSVALRPAPMTPTVAPGVTASQAHRRQEQKK